MHEAQDPNTSVDRLWELSGIMQEKLSPEQIRTAELVATNPIAPGELLRVLAEMKHPSLQRAVALNPNTPLLVLLRLADAFPAALQNPALPLLLLENPNPIEQLPQNELRFVRYAETPLLRLEQAALLTHEQVALWVAQNPSLPSHLLSKLAESSFHTVRQQIARHPKVNRDLIAAWSQSQSLNAQITVALSPWVTEEQLYRISAVENALLAEAIRQSDLLSDRLLRRLATDRSMARRKVIAGLRYAPKDVLAKLSQDRAASVRQAVKSNPTFSP
jgi:hypothetical protein